PLPDANGCVFVITVNGGSSKVEFGTHSRTKEIAVKHEVAVFLNAVQKGQGKPVTCKAINEEHHLDLRPYRICKKIPDALRPCFVTKAGSGTYFDKDALAEICHNMCFD